MAKVSWSTGGLFHPQVDRGRTDGGGPHATLSQPLVLQARPHPSLVVHRQAPSRPPPHSPKLHHRLPGHVGDGGRAHASTTRRARRCERRAPAIALGAARPAQRRSSGQVTGAA
eukprot:TRINITY_DN17912_c0_g1_i1.p2 TRINITY_DN17912_c0_g1~~TRINITY_DN17912_c0_g1_i1.p2  ORF type:complete len:114 (-),score=12.18 TRINITY_DN17912_c0_g1_i1:276-617(-)